MPTPIPLPTNPDDTLSNLEAFIRLVRILRMQCPWDMKQTHASISHLLVEEAYETVDAIEKTDDEELSKELGDILLHVVMHSVMAEQRGAFTLQDVIKKEFNKLVNRHPHIFADEVAEDESVVLQNWERLKMKEGRTSVLDGVPKSLPAALRAQRVQEKAANVGFDWHDRRDVWGKVDEELEELRVELDEQNHDAAKREFGDVLFALVNAARHEGIIAEDALHGTTNTFMSRFQYIERRAIETGRDLRDMDLAEMDEFWNEAKQHGL
ncbi:MAG: nucleoside triphosphate pyrophosphohydrolase [Bradyrhizobiaceae bacterium]|nr:nucleoside triphosphate pyrophosphohydrolase [Bradyrhizobiaceae bacterium]